MNQTTKYRSSATAPAGYGLLHLFMFGLLACAVPKTHGKELDVAYVTTPEDVIDLMLDQANVGPGDYVIDLGTGDGRIILSAVRRGATGLGIDLDPHRISEARASAGAAGLSHRVMFKEQDLFETDISQASVITLFLNEKVNLKLRAKLLSELEPGTRVVSHNFDMGDWQPDRHQGIMVHDGPNYYLHDVFTWIIPARLEGRWQWEAGGKQFHMAVKQKYQEVEISMSTGDGRLEVSQAYLGGRRINIRAGAPGGGTSYTFIGTVRNGEILGDIRIEQSGAEPDRIVPWPARPY